MKQKTKGFMIFFHFFYLCYGQWTFALYFTLSVCQSIIFLLLMNVVILVVMVNSKSSTKFLFVRFILPNIFFFRPWRIPSFSGARVLGSFSKCIIHSGIWFLSLSYWTLHTLRKLTTNKKNCKIQLQKMYLQHTKKRKKIFKFPAFLFTEPFLWIEKVFTSSPNSKIFFIAFSSFLWLWGLFS